jgi:SPP1 gp7 family putative phage head morphogenesis protein
VTVNSDIADEIVKHRLFLLRYEGGAVRRLLEAYDDVTGSIWAEIDRLRYKARGVGLTSADRQRMRDLKRTLEVGVRVFQQRADEILEESIKAAAEAERRIVAAKVSDALPSSVKAGFSLAPDADRLVALADFASGRPWQVRLAVDLVEQQMRIQSVLDRASAEGLSMPKTARLLKTATGIEGTYRNRYVAIARTEVQRVANVAAMQTYDANRDVVKGVQYLATLDSRTCLRCAPLHNKVYLYQGDGRLLADDGTEAPVIPIHPRCRCFYTPVTKSWEELGIDVEPDPDLDGEPAPEMSFPQWLKRQDEGTQLDVFDGSAKRWKAWKTGAVPFDEFATPQKTRTLEELRATHSGFRG